MDEQTAWEDIGGAVRRESSLPVRASRRALEARATDIHDLEPVDRSEFFAEVGPCLALTMGVGMSPGDQDAWLEAAFIALDGIPIGLLRRGVRAAMLNADHPSKIIPAIMAEIGANWTWRREHRPAQPMIEGPRPPRGVQALMDARGKPMTDAETNALNAHLERIGSPARYYPDGSKLTGEAA